MRRGTTPYFNVKVKSADLDGAHVSVTIRQGEVTIEKTGKELLVIRNEQSSQLQFKLTQEETLKLKAGKAVLQARWIEPDGTAYASRCINVKISDILNGEVVYYG